MIREFGYREPRISTDFPLQFQTDKAGPRWVEARCLEMSEEGMAIRTVAWLTIGTRITLRLIFPGSSGPVGLVATIVRGQGGDYGLNFLFSSQTERDVVRQFMALLTVLPVRRSE